MNLYEGWLHVLRDTKHFPFFKYTNQSVIAVMTRLGAGWLTSVTVWGLLNGFLLGLLALSVLRRDELKTASLSFLVMLTIPSIVWKEYHVALLLPYLVVHQMLFDRKIPRFFVFLFFARLLFVNGFVQAIVGRALSIRVDEYGAFLWGVPLLAAILWSGSEPARKG